MIFYYTNSVEPGGIQTVARLSTGGFVSGSIVPNDVLNEIFSNISLNTETNTQYRLLALKNTLPNTVDNIVMKFYLNEDIISQFEVALVLPALDKCNDYVFEKIASQYSKPMTGQFQIVSDGLQIDGGSLDPGAVLGVWLCRKFDVEGNPVKSCEELGEDYNNEVVVEKEDDIQINVMWDDAESVSSSASVSVSVSSSASAL